MSFRQLRQDSLRLFGFLVLSHVVNLLCKSLRINVVNKEIIDKLEAENRSYVIAFWHGTMLLPWFLHRRKKISALISKSKDGELLTKILRNWKYDVVRGSSHKGGEVALGIMVDYAKNKVSVAVTPDGPRGPEHKMKAGAVITAKKSGIPLVLLGTGYKKKKILKSWDKFEVPIFFTQAKAVYAGPYYINSDLDYKNTNDLIMEYERKLNEIQQEAGNFKQ